MPEETGRRNGDELVKPRVTARAWELQVTLLCANKKAGMMAKEQPHC